MHVHIVPRRLTPEQRSAIFIGMYMYCASKASFYIIFRLQDTYAPSGIALSDTPPLTYGVPYRHITTAVQWASMTFVPPSEYPSDVWKPAST